ncbi:Vault poly [Fusarium acutatum]|uniref:Vault poly n=1 Tax=Fusarium acutatum TaxID=78861 RepID=A0A8H4NQJ2_9HYPO|nr:Vault poly [Fusarium acutatum]
MVGRTPAPAVDSDDDGIWNEMSKPSSMPKDTPIHEFWEPVPAALTPQIQREIIPGGPKFPTFRAIPIPDPRFDLHSRCIARTIKQRRGASKTWNSDYDSDDSSMSRGISESPSSQSKVYGPLDWQFAMECQDGQGLFGLDERRPSLHLHFCPETVTKFGPKISELLHSSTTPEEERDDTSARLLDTLMMIECYKTHRAQEEDTWDLMMERAWDAVISVLGLSDEEETLEELVGQLRGAMIHAHYVVATGVKGSEKDGSSVGTVKCPACEVAWRTNRQFFCPFDHESDDVDEFTSWDDFWKHQVDQGHVVCPQEVV